MRFFGSLAVGVGAIVPPALGFDHADQASLLAALDRYAAHIESERFIDVDAAIPPGIYTVLLEQFDGTERELRAKMIELETRKLGDTDVLEVSFETDGIEVQTTTDGIDYAFVPTVTVASEGLGPDVTSYTQTFALQDTGRWYFFHLERQSAFELVQAAYPSFASVTAPPPKEPTQ